MFVREFGVRRKRRDARWLTVGALLTTTAFIAVPDVKAAGEIVDPSLPDVVYYNIPALSGDGTRYMVNVYDQVNALSTGYYVEPGGTTSVPGFGGDSHIFDMSGDGQYVVGRSRTLNGNSRAFIWDAPNGLVTDLGLLHFNVPSATLTARSVSGDGSVVVGDSFRQGMTRAFAWVRDATTGVAHNPQMYQLSGLGSANHWRADAVSDDGRYGVGMSDGDATTSMAVRWDLSGLAAGGVGADVLLPLGSFVGETEGWSLATDVSADGRIVVGGAGDVDGMERAFRWVEGATSGVQGNVQMHDLGTLSPSNSTADSRALAVSRDGALVVGWSHVDNNLDKHAFRWSEAEGMESVAAWLARNDVNTAAGQVLTEATTISDDGSVVAGVMDTLNGPTRAFIARVAPDGEEPPPGGGNPPPPGGGGLMDVEEYNRTLFAAAGVASMGQFLSWLPLNGAHHRPLLLTPDLTGDMCAWATGDFGHDGGSSTNMALAEVGSCFDLAGGSVRIGGAAGISTSWQQLALGGSINMAGQYVLGEVDWQPDGTPLLLSLTGMLGGWNADIARAYSNGSATAVSNGKTNLLGGVVRIRADWLNAAEIGNTSLSPWISASMAKLHVDGYSETGGSFPATFAAQTLGHGEVRAGLSAVTSFSSQTSLATTFEVAHRAGTAPSATGQVHGLFNFGLGGGTQGKTWVRVGAELDHAISESLAASGSIHLATAGGDPTLGLSIGLKGAF